MSALDWMVIHEWTMKKNLCSGQLKFIILNTANGVGSATPVITLS